VELEMMEPTEPVDRFFVTVQGLFVVTHAGHKPPVLLVDLLLVSRPLDIGRVLQNYMPMVGTIQDLLKTPCQKGTM
jgi:hypothetical protein